MPLARQGRGDAAGFRAGRACEGAVGTYCACASPARGPPGGSKGTIETPVSGAAQGILVGTRWLYAG